MNEVQVIRAITEFNGVQTATDSGSTYFFYDPERHFPFVTLVTNDAHDAASNLERPGVFRLNIGVKRTTYQQLFGPQPAFPKDGGVVDTGHDYTALDVLTPHPVYAAMSWVCILNPSTRTFIETVVPLLSEAYEEDLAKYAERAARRT